MQNNICPECKTENEPEYQYCKNCGTPLFTAPESTNTAYRAPEPAAAAADTIDGNTVEDVVAFTGKNAPKIVPAFIKMEKTGSKVSWSWPPFILGFFFGPIGVAIWFLYRKMYSKASIFAGIGILLNYISFVLDRFFHIGQSTINGFEKYFEDFLYGRVDYESILSAFTSRNSIISFFASSLQSSIVITCAVLGGIFGMYLYKQHTAKAIYKINSTFTDTGYKKFALVSKGGTSVGAVIVGLIIITVLSNIPEAIYSVIKVMEGVIRL